MTTPFSSGQFRPETWASGNSNSNTQDSSSQLALGSAGDIGLSGAWKCSVCKVAFDSGQSFADHLEELQKAKHKCLPCHKVFEERRLVYFHIKITVNIVTKILETSHLKSLARPMVATLKRNLFRELGHIMCSIWSFALTTNEQ